MVGGVQLWLKSNFIPSKDVCRAQANLVCTKDPGKEPLQETEPVLPVRVWGSPAEARVSSGLLRWRGADNSSPGKCSEWHKSSWRKSPLAPLESHPVGDPQIREQFYLRSSWAVAKLLAPTTDFQTWESGKRTETPQGIWLWRTRVFDYRTSTGKFWNRDSWRAQAKPGAHQDPRERSSDPTRDWATLACDCLGVSGGGVGHHGLLWGQEHGPQQSREAWHAGINPFGGVGLCCDIILVIGYGVKRRGDRFRVRGCTIIL